LRTKLQNSCKTERNTKKIISSSIQYAITHSANTLKYSIPKIFRDRVKYLHLPAAGFAYHQLCAECKVSEDLWLQHIKNNSLS